MAAEAQTIGEGIANDVDAVVGVVVVIRMAVMRGDDGLKVVRDDDGGGGESGVIGTKARRLLSGSVDCVVDGAASRESGSEGIGGGVDGSGGVAGFSGRCSIVVAVAGVVIVVVAAVEFS